MELQNFRIQTSDFQKLLTRSDQRLRSAAEKQIFASNFGLSRSDFSFTLCLWGVDSLIDLWFYLFRLYEFI